MNSLEPHNHTDAQFLPDIVFSDLNPPQAEAVKHFEGPILVLAGAGSGKTRILTRRVASLILTHGVRPQEILAVTFTNKATEEMRERLRKVLGERANELWVATFHSAALRMLRRHAPKLGYTNDFVVYDEQDAKGVLKGILKDLNINEKRFPVQLFSRLIDNAKNAFILPENFKGSGGTKYEQDLHTQVYLAYQHALLKANAMDFGDLLVNAVRLLQRPEILQLYQQSLRFILVDEYQDTNAVQYLFVRMISAPRNNLLVVGDDDQSIYAFRGATIRNILEFEKDYPNAKVVKLEQNYRSTANILNAAHSIIEKNVGRKKKKLWTSEHTGSAIGTFVADDEMEEADFIAREIVTRKQSGTTYNNIAIFYRTNAQSRAIEEALIKNRIPYRIFGGLKFYDRKEIKDILAYLRLLVNEADNQAFIRTVNTPPRGIGAQTLQQIDERAKLENVSLFSGAASYVASGKAGKIKAIEDYLALIIELKEASHKITLGELIHLIIEKTGYVKKLENTKDIAAESRIENLGELEALGRSSVNEGEKPFDTLRGFLNKIALTASSDIPVDEKDAEQKAVSGTVSLMTLHLAKGLEFPVVFLTGLEEGLIPHYRSIESAVGIEEERRLCYVGITRAMKSLFITRAVRRGMFSSGQGFGVSGLYRKPSRFAFDLPKETLNDISESFTTGTFSEFSFLQDDEREDIEFESSDEGRKNGGRKSFGDEEIEYRGPGAGKGSGTYQEKRARFAAGLSLMTADGLSKNLKIKSAGGADPFAGKTQATPSDLGEGVSVLHSVFGEGIIEKLIPAEPMTDSEVLVRFKNFEGSKKLILKYARLWLR